jgi:CHRD domain
MNRVRQSFLVASIAALLVCVAAAPAFAAQQELFKAHLKGSDEVPARQTPATGQATFTWKTADPSIFEFKVTVGNIENVTAIQLQMGARGQNGPVVATLYGPVAPGDGRKTGMIADGALSATNLTGDLAGHTIADLVSAIRSGNVYVNVLTDDGLGAPDEKPGDFSSGEIRGQIE